MRFYHGRGKINNALESSPFNRGTFVDLDSLEMFNLTKRPCLNRNNVVESLTFVLPPHAGK